MDVSNKYIIGNHEMHYYRSSISSWYKHTQTKWIQLITVFGCKKVPLSTWFWIFIWTMLYLAQTSKSVPYTGDCDAKSYYSLPWLQSWFKLASAICIYICRDVLTKLLKETYYCIVLSWQRIDETWNHSKTDNLLGKFWSSDNCHLS